MSKITLQRVTQHAANPASRPDMTNEPTANPLHRLQHYLGSELIYNRSEIGLRAIRILTNEFVDEITPNPDKKPWQDFMELLAPIAIAHCIAFGLLRNTGEPVSNLVYGVTQEMISRLFMVQFFLKKVNLKYIAVMIMIYALAFYHSSAGKRIWSQNENAWSNESFIGRRQRYLEAICGDRKNFVSVAVDGLSSLALYKLIDTAVKKIPVPEWLLLTPIHHTGSSRLKEEFTDGTA